MNECRARNLPRSKALHANINTIHPAYSIIIYKTLDFYIICNGRYIYFLHVNHYLSTCMYLHNIQVKDLLQLMIDSTVDDGGDGKSPTKLTTKQMTGFSVDFLLAGYETTSNLLSFTSYALAMNIDIQDKLQAEIDQHFEDDPVIITHDQCMHTLTHTHNNHAFVN